MKHIEVAAAAIIHDKQVLITQRSTGDFKGQWEFPGGKIEANETQEEALIREIKEELLCDIKADKHLITITYQYPQFHLRMHLYISTITNGKPILTEHTALRWVKAHELDSVDWLPADIDIIPVLKDYLLNLA